MKFQVDVPDHIFWKIAEKAELFEQRVPDFAADLLVVAAAMRDVPEADPVVRLWRAGLSDSQIAGRLGLVNATVSSRRRGFGLPANRRRWNDEGAA
jgi:hypothetical protein